MSNFLFFLEFNYVACASSCRFNETSGGAQEARGAPQPGAAETKADGDEVCFLSGENRSTCRVLCGLFWWLRSVLSTFFQSGLRLGNIFPLLFSKGMKRRGGDERRR